MKSLILSFILMLLCSAAIAQSDLNIKVKKPAPLSISPDSMYFRSHICRAFKIRGIPAGCKLRASFSGGNITIRDSSLILEPFYVYRDTDVANYQSKNISGFKATKDAFYTADLLVTVNDAKGEIKGSLSRKCYIIPERYITTGTALSAATFPINGSNYMQLFTSSVLSDSISISAAEGNPCFSNSISK